jgi:diaminopimelate decarboxylase
MIPALVAGMWKMNAAGELLIGGMSVSDIAARHGTPLFIYDRSIMERKLVALREALPPKFSISYSVKANPNPNVLRFFLDRGCGLEIASIGEYHLARSVGCLPEKIFFAGPGKTEAELEIVIAQGIGEIHAESKLEIQRLSAISRKFGLRTPVALRVNPDEQGEGGAMRMGGKSAPFGVDEEDMVPLLLQIANDPYLDFCGIHLFVGTQILDYQTLLAQYEKGLKISRCAAEITGIALRTVDFGGGLGIPYFPGDSELDLAGFRDALRNLMAKIANDRFLAQVNFVLEPGRFLVGEAGVYVAKINDIKMSRGKKYLILDGGMNHHLAASGNLGQVIKRNFPIALLNRGDVAATESVEIVGPLCTPLDTLGRSVELPSPAVGDLVGIFQSGAYARTASPLGFLSHSTPPEVWIEENKDFVIRERGIAEGNVADLCRPGVGEPVT